LQVVPVSLELDVRRRRVPSPARAPCRRGAAATIGAPEASSPPSSPPATTEVLPEGLYSGDPLTDPTCETFNAMSAIFEGYEKELLELSSAITRKAALIPTLTRGACCASRRAPAQRAPRAAGARADARRGAVGGRGAARKGDGG
jgi:hypothetical protein